MNKANVNNIIYGAMLLLIYTAISKLLYNFSVDIGDKMLILYQINLPFLKVLTVPVSLLLVFLFGRRIYKELSDDSFSNQLFTKVFTLTIILVGLSYFSGKYFNIFYVSDMDWASEFSVYSRNIVIMDVWEYFLMFITIFCIKSKLD